MGRHGGDLPRLRHDGCLRLRAAAPQAAAPGAPPLRRLPAQPRHHHRADHARLQRAGVSSGRPARHRPHARCGRGRAGRGAVVLRGGDAGYASVGINNKWR